MAKFCNTLQSYPICERTKPPQDPLTDNGPTEELADVKIAAIYHSETVNAWQMAELVGERCRKIEGVETRCMAVGGVDEDDVIESSPAIFGSPTFVGTCS